MDPERTILFDSHCHLDDSSYDKDLDKVIERAFDNGVAGMISVAIDVKSAKKAIAAAMRFESIYASVGLHPHLARYGSLEMLDEMKELAGHDKVVAWGEMGLDFNRMFSPAEKQEKWFEIQLAAASEAGLPAIFHERDSKGRFLEILRQARPVKGVVHCFSGTKKELRDYLDLGLLIGVTGIVTMESRGARLREILRYAPLDRILIETDAPYLTPAPERKRRNEPAFVRRVFESLLSLYSLDGRTLAQRLLENSRRLFGINLGDATLP